MNAAYYKTIIMIATIALGYLLKQINILTKEDAKTISKIMMNITLPATIIINLNGTRLNMDILGAVILGFLVNVAFYLVSVFFSDKNNKDDQLVKLFSLCSFNIGSFTYPLLNGVVSPLASTAILTFNYPGTAIFTYGLPPALGETIASGKKKSFLKTLGKNVIHSVTTISCLSMILLCLLNISLPNAFIGFLTTVAGANFALAMLCIGILLNFKLSKSEILENIKVVLLRLGIAVVCAILIYCFSPLSFEIRRALTLTVFSPIATSMPATALHCGYNGSRVAIVNSLYLVVSICSMAFLIAIMY